MLRVNRDFKPQAVQDAREAMHEVERVLQLECEGAFIQGIFGIGGETYGRIKMAAVSHEQELTVDLIKPDMEGCVIIGGGVQGASVAFHLARAQVGDVVLIEKSHPASGTCHNVAPTTSGPRLGP